MVGRYLDDTVAAVDTNKLAWFRISGLEFRVQGLRVEGFGFVVDGLWFRVSGSEVYR